MAKKKSDKIITNPLDAEIAELRKIGRGQRTEEENERLAALLAEDRRARFLRYIDRRRTKLLDAVAKLIQLSNPASYQYTDDEAQQIAAGIDKLAAEVKAAFKGVPKEKGLWDI